MKLFLCAMTVLSSMSLTSCFQSCKVPTGDTDEAAVEMVEIAETKAPKHASNIIYLEEQVTKYKSAKEALVALTSSGIVMVDFFAEWCGPCRSLGKTLEKVAPDHPEVKFIKVNVDQFGALASDANVKGIPAIMFYKDGNMKQRYTGALSASEIKSIIANL